MKPVSKPTSSSSIAPNSTNINNNSITVLDDDDAAVATTSSSSNSQQHQQRSRKDAATVSKQQRIQPQAASDVSRCPDTCSVTASAASIIGIDNDIREQQQLAVPTASTSNCMDVPDSGTKSAAVMSPPALEEDDPYAELERILEKAQAEISEMFAQTVQAEKLKAASTASAGTLESEEGGPLKRKSGSEQAFRDGRGGIYPQRQHHQHHHPQHDASHHHIKYATIPHGNVASQNNIHSSTLASSTSTGRRKPAENGEAKRTRNTFDPRYRSNELELVVSSTTMVAPAGAAALATTTTTTGAATGTHSSASSLLQTSSDSSNASGGANGYCGGRTELSDSLSDDMSLLEVGTPYDEGQECAGDDTSDELAMHSIRRYPLYHTQPYHHHHHHHHQHHYHPAMAGTPGATMAVAFRPSSSGFYRKHHDDSPPTDRRLKTSTNSLPSVAVASGTSSSTTPAGGGGGGHRNLALHLKFKSHQSAIDAKRKQFFLALDQEPFQPLKSNMADLPSPSSTSLHSGHNHLIAEELGCKSSSAPVLKDEGNALTVPRANLRYSRSQSDRHLAEIEAIEACRWLRAAGFPQYAQMYEDHQFPIDVENVEKDHPFLENDPLQSLFRRLHTLNRCANMHLDAHQHHTPKPSQREDSDDDSCALSEAWTFQHNSRRWSRVDDAIGLVSVIANKQKSAHSKDATTKGAATGGDLLDPNSNGSRHSRTSSKKHHQQTQLVRAEDHEKLWLESGGGGTGRITIGVPSDTDSQDDSGGGGGAVNLRRTGSERLKDGAKAILRHVESIRSRRRKKQHREGLIILAPPASHHHLSPHRNGGGEAGGEMGGGYVDMMSYSNPTSPRPSAEMLQFDDGLAMGAHHRHCFPGATPAEGVDRNLLSPYLSNAANAWSPAGTIHGDSARRGTPNVLLPFQVQLQQHEARSGDDSSSICSEDSGGGPGNDYELRSTASGTGGRVKYAPRAKKALRSKVITSTVDDYQSGGGALSDSEYQSKQRRSKIKSELDRTSGADGSVTSTTTKSTTASTLAPEQPSKLHRGGSLNLGKASKRYRDAFSNRSVRHSSKAANEEWDGGTRGTSKRSTVARWHSFQQPKVSPSDAKQQLPIASTATAATAAKTLTDPLVVTIPSKDGDPLGMRTKQQQQQKQAQQRANQQLVTSSNTASFDGKPTTDLTISSSTGLSAVSGRSSGPGLRMTEMSCGQLLVVRKLGLANLTGYMERYCPTHRSGWNWDLPKFIKRIKTPDYKDRRVFGMPLVLNLQRYGSTVPYSIRMAFSWLERNALDQVGLFRKPGVKSRIAKLKSVIEASNDVGCRSEMFDEYHAYDVADLLKQYFRELPDVLLTAKLSETFIAIFQYLPDEVRAEAIQSAILLLPDEHREVLHLLLTFLEKVVQNSSLNQMTANNLAVCFAPSLFYLLAGNRYTAASPRRKKTGAGTGQPDERELSEAKASHECLAYMIERFQSLWTITSDQMRRCNFNYMDESKPVPLASLGAEMHVQNWRGYLSECLNECLREGRERPRGWVSLSSTDPSVAVFFKKVGDGHPLRLWKCVTEVEAPPVEVIQHIVNERPLWDAYLLKWRTIEQLDQDADVFQYACGQPITEYCVVRQWKNDLPRGACVIVELSISHENATSLLGGVSGVVLASRYLIEPCGSGRCKLMHLSRVDMKGRTPDWYNKNYGHICQQYLSKIKKFFQHCTEGPETKV